MFERSLSPSVLAILNATLIALVLSLMPSTVGAHPRHERSPAATALGAVQIGGVRHSHVASVPGNPRADVFVCKDLGTSCHACAAIVDTPGASRWVGRTVTANGVDPLARSKTLAPPHGPPRPHR